MICNVNVKLKKLFSDVETPVYATDGSAGFDLVAHNIKHETGIDCKIIKVMGEYRGVLIQPHGRILIGCGYSLEIPKGYELQIRSRSGLALKKGLCLSNGVGTIDEDYRGEIGVILLNNSPFAVEVRIGDKIAQAILTNYCKSRFEVVAELGETQRGEGGFGSTDKPNPYIYPGIPNTEKKSLKIDELGNREIY